MRTGDFGGSLRPLTFRSHDRTVSPSLSKHGGAEEEEEEEEVLASPEVL